MRMDNGGMQRFIGWLVVFVVATLVACSRDAASSTQRPATATAAENAAPTTSDNRKYLL